MNSAKQQDTILTQRTWLHFFTLTMEYQKRNLKKKKYLLKNHTPKNKFLKNKLDHGGERLIH